MSSVQPISPAAAKGSMAPPPTVSMTPDQVRKALAASADVGATRDTNAERHATGLKRDAGRFKAGTNGNGGLIAGIGRGK